MPPTLGHGKICYLLIPAVDPRGSAAFYAEVFDWKIRERDGGQISFDDGVGEVSGMWVTGRPPVDASFVYIMVGDMKRTCAAVAEAGGEIVEAPDAAARDVVAAFRDPAGNIFGLYEQRGLPVS